MLPEIHHRLATLDVELDGRTYGRAYAIVNTQTGQTVFATTSASEVAAMLRRLVDADLIRRGHTPTQHYPQPTKRGQHR
jgi:hypothetical protein